MNVVSRVGSLITQGVYSVATPFHPFGGAVDIIIVEQQDGTYRSTPWYVRFGKFQGVLKGAEKIVQISVNGIEADFHMYLDNSGEAYFIREESGNEDTETETNKFDSSGCTDSIKADITVDTSQEKDECNIEEDSIVPLFNFDENHLEDNSIDSSEYSAYHYGSLHDVEDVVKSSENLNTEMVLVSVDGHVLMAPLSSNEENMENVQLSTPQFHLGPGESSAQDFTSGEGDWEEGLFTGLDATAPECEHHSGHPFTESIQDMHLLNHYREVKCIHSVHENSSTSENVGLGMKGKDTFMSCLEFSELTAETECCYSPGSNPSSVPINDRNDHRTSTDNSLLQLQKTEEMESGADGQPGSSGKPLFLSDATFGLTSKLKSDNKAASGITVGDTSCLQLTSYIDNHCNDMLPMTDMQNVSSEKNVAIEDSDSEPSPSVPNESLIMGVESKCNQKENSQEHSAVKEECSRSEISGFEISLCGNLLHPGMGQKSANDAFDAHRISKEEFESSGTEIIKNSNLIVRFKGKYLPWDAAAPLVLAMAVFGLESSPDSQKFIPIEEESLHDTQDTCAMSSSFSSRRWRLWPIPFRRVRTLQHSNSDSSTSDVFVDSSSSLHSPRAESMQSSTVTDNHSPHRQFIRTNIPTTEQMASLKLRDGRNTIAFSFSTRVLGKQQVDAHVYLWKWNTRIVISDVDGTITKSDVLGQFMPLVGRDWTQSGVARLFSAIKENGYQLLFLSARAIVQAYLTRSFLLNLKQDGKALPNGPVVISPDGLFPSLYREVIRRAPHEFKIACLEDIRALFPSDYNPFYAGFGNRDTDELSYRKMGIPKGKIFIINPKGEVAINHCIDVKSYTSLHTLVNDMFPSTSVAEQEDFNSWNYWKMPLPSID